jgi:predicted DNA-binding protein with PD1-like motif
MKYSTAKPGRTFVIRLEDGEIVHEVLEQFARDHGVRAAHLVALGGADTGSRFITGPTEGRADPVVPQEHVLEGVYEVAGTGTLFPNHDGDPILHMHLAAGRGDHAVTGCVRRGVKVWHVLEVIMTELTDTPATRLPEPAIGFELLAPLGPDQ